jgi:catechol 2,3-dioxygenase-like lactoylglutathione lyase family enzyme
MQPAKLVPELYCSNFERSLAFYVGVLGFTVLYARPEERFGYLDREGAEIMIEQPTEPWRTWSTGDLLPPFGRGINLQTEVSDVAALRLAVVQAGHSLFLELEDRWYRRDDSFVGNRQFLVQDPDGYLLRSFQDLGIRQTA